MDSSKDSKDVLAKIIIHDLDEDATHWVNVPRPTHPNASPYRYRVSFTTNSGLLVQHWIFITHSTKEYPMSVKGRFIITA